MERDSKTPSTPATMSKQHCRMLQSRILLRQSRTLFGPRCWCGPGLIDISAHH